jgi:5-formyltetrahydrofolate cyclo-ligase
VYVWNRLHAERAGAFPFPLKGRIPNFKGARQAAERLLAHKIFKKIRWIKVNPDAPQRYVRELALRRGIEVSMPTPRLKGGFKHLNPRSIPEEEIAEAVSLRSVDRWSTTISPRDLPQVDLIVTRSVAVTRTGRRCGKGHGYSDLEYAILRELEHPSVPMVTTVHPLQVVDDFPTDPHDLPVSLIVTPDEVIEVENPPAALAGIDWSQLTEDDLSAMPILHELRSLKGH